LNLRGMFMAMTMLKIKDNEASLSIAGMPSALIHRAGAQSVEEIAIRAMPLGSLAKTKYQEQQINLSTGDVIVIMSDGFPEMFNAENEMLGFDKAAEILPRIAANSAQEIVDHLVKVGEDWANGRLQDDDVTFVVLKIKTDKEV
jgi:serine phosphatase RsbU (regulator of sigma subunit)